MNIIILLYEYLKIFYILFLPFTFMSNITRLHRTWTEVTFSYNVNSNWDCTCEESIDIRRVDTIILLSLNRRSVVLISLLLIPAIYSVVISFQFQIIYPAPYSVQDKVLFSWGHTSNVGDGGYSVVSK